MSATVIFLSLLVTLVVSAFLYVKNAFAYWKRRSVPYKSPSFPFGNFASAFLKKKSFGEALADLYSETNEPFQGVFITFQPALLVRDPNIIKDILIKDFQSFNHRGWQANTDIDPMANNILVQKGEKWKSKSQFKTFCPDLLCLICLFSLSGMRTQFSPAFTSGKIKAMFETMVDCGSSLDKYIDSFADTGKSIEIREAFSRFSVNLIGRVAFGIELDCFEHPDCDFRKYREKFFEPTLKTTLRFNLSFMSPTLAKLFRIRFADKEVGDFMRETFRENLEYREKNNVSRKDFFQLLMQLRNTGKISEDGDWQTKATNDAKSMTLDEMVAQAFLFFAGGFESSSATMSFCMYEFAKHPDKQQKAYEEIVEILEKYNGKLTYDALGEMKYMANCIDGMLMKKYMSSFNYIFQIN